VLKEMERVKNNKTLQTTIWRISTSPTYTLRNSMSLNTICRIQERLDPTPTYRTNPLARPLVVVLRVQNPQDGQEQVDDVEVERNGRGNLLLDVVVAHDHLRVDQDVPREDERADDTVSQLDLAAVREERRHEAEQDHYPERAEQVRHPACEVILGLAREQGKRDKDAECEDGGFDHDLGVCERYDDRDGVGFHGSEATKEQQVGRIRLALPEREAEECECAEQRHPHHPRVGLDPVLI
jgi:hypothetical protein